MIPGFQNLLTSYRREGVALIPAAIPKNIAVMLKSIYTKGVENRKGSSYPFLDGKGPFTKVYGTAPIPVAQDSKQLSCGEKSIGLIGKNEVIPSYTVPGENTELKKIAISCRSIKERDRVINRLQKTLGPRVMTTEEFDKIFGKEDLASNEHFLEYINKTYYYAENYSYIDNIANNKFNVFQSFPDIRDSVLMSEQEIIPFSIAAHLCGCIAMRLWCENFFTKLPMSNSLPFHCTLPFIGLCNNRGQTECRGCTIWIILDDVPKKCGGISILKNTHTNMKDKFAIIENIKEESLPAMSFEFDLWYREYIKHIDHQNGKSPDVYFPDLKRGDVVILSNATLYGLSANPSNCSWKALQYHLVPEGSIFAGTRSSWVSRQLLKDAKPGEYIQDEANFPLVANAI